MDGGHPVKLGWLCHITFAGLRLSASGENVAVKRHCACYSYELQNPFVSCRPPREFATSAC